MRDNVPAVLRSTTSKGSNLTPRPNDTQHTDIILTVVRAVNVAGNLRPYLHSPKN